MTSGNVGLTYPGTTGEERHAVSVGVLFVFFVTSFVPLSHDGAVWGYKEISVKYNIFYFTMPKQKQDCVLFITF